MNASTKPIENVMLYLNTKVNCSKTTLYRNAKTHKVTCTWNISPIVLNEYSIMKTKTVAHQATGGHSSDHGDSLITIRINDIQYNPELYRSTDNSLPIVFCGSFNAEPNYTDASIGGIYLPPQTINRVTLIFTDLIDDSYAGVDDDLDWVIGLCFIPYDRSFSLTEN